MSAAVQLKSIFRRAVWDIAIFCLITNLLMLVTPLYMLQIYDRVLGSGSLETLSYLSAFALFALLLLGIIDIVRSRYATRVAAQLEAKLGENALGLALTSPRAAIGDIQPLRDLSMVRNFIGSRSLFTFFDLPFAPLFLVVLYLIHPQLFVIVFVGTICLVILAIASSIVVAGAAKSAGEANLSAFGVAQSFVREAESIKAMGMGSNVLRLWGNQISKELAHTDNSGAIISTFAGISRALRLVLQMAVLGYGAVLVLDEQITAGMIFASSLIASRALQPIDQLVAIWPQFISTSQAWARLRKGLSTLTDTIVPTELPVSKGHLRIENLFYAPPHSPQGHFILKSINLNVKPGESVVIVGRSGAGKSTLVRLMVGAITPSSGTVRVDGGDIPNWDPAELGKSIGYLSQNAELLPGTIAENIGRFGEGVEDADIVGAAQTAQAHDIIQSFPQGYETVIGPGGISLSGGQRQRVGLARAFFKNPKLIVLDEPNSNLDSEGDAALEAAIIRARANGSTVVVVSQKKHIVRAVDHMVEMDSGMVREFGPVGVVMKSITDRANSPSAQKPDKKQQESRRVPARKDARSSENQHSKPQIGGE